MSQEPYLPKKGLMMVGIPAKKKKKGNDELSDFEILI